MLALIGGWLLIVLAGIAIGATSIGGVIVVPALTALLAMTLPTALAVSSLAFLATGLWALLHEKSNTLSTLLANAPLMMSALVGAFMGAYGADLVPIQWGRLWVGCLALASGIYSLLQMKQGDVNTAHHHWPSKVAQVGIGFFVGAGSSLSGTGGPVLLLPFLSLTQRPIERSIATAQLIQIPIALAASAAHLSANRINWEMSFLVAFFLLSGAVLGKKLSQRYAIRVLKIITSVLLIITGVWFLFPAN
ncbi:MAG: hypothetical protein RL706_568 [Pseudomonadota bacterium]|jgi:uncharacterized membrane protein YfcA